MLDALLATIGTLGVLASLLAKRRKDRGGADADADADTDTNAPLPAGQDDGLAGGAGAFGRRRGCPHRRVRPHAAKGTGR